MSTKQAESYYPTNSYRGSYRGRGYGRGHTDPWQPMNASEYLMWRYGFPSGAPTAMHGAPAAGALSPLREGLRLGVLGGALGVGIGGVQRMIHKARGQNGGGQRDFYQPMLIGSLIGGLLGTTAGWTSQSRMKRPEGESFADIAAGGIGKESATMEPQGLSPESMEKKAAIVAALAALSALGFSIWDIMDAKRNFRNAQRAGHAGQLGEGAKQLGFGVGNLGLAGASLATGGLAGGVARGYKATKRTLQGMKALKWLRRGTRAGHVGKFLDPSMLHSDQYNPAAPRWTPLERLQKTKQLERLIAAKAPKKAPFSFSSLFGLGNTTPAVPAIKPPPLTGAQLGQRYGKQHGASFGAFLKAMGGPGND